MLPWLIDEVEETERASSAAIHSRTASSPTAIDT
jgi:hypothetical protein